MVELKNIKYQGLIALSGMTDIKENEGELFSAEAPFFEFVRMIEMGHNQEHIQTTLASNPAFYSGPAFDAAYNQYIREIS